VIPKERVPLRGARSMTYERQSLRMGRDVSKSQGEERKDDTPCTEDSRHFWKRATRGSTDVVSMDHCSRARVRLGRLWPKCKSLGIFRPLKEGFLCLRPILVLVEHHVGTRSLAAKMLTVLITFPLGLLESLSKPWEEKRFDRSRSSSDYKTARPGQWPALHLTCNPSNFLFFPH